MVTSPLGKHHRKECRKRTKKLLDHFSPRDFLEHQAHLGRFSGQELLPGQVLTDSFPVPSFQAGHDESRDPEDSVPD